jgi:hypothetical protein
MRKYEIFSFFIKFISIIIHIILNLCIRSIIERIRLQYIRYRKTRAIKRTFDVDTIQQPGTFIQQAHTTKGVRGKSSSASKQRTCQDMPYSLSALNFNKEYTSRPQEQCDTCPFNISIVLNKIDQLWYLRYDSYLRNKIVTIHRGYLSVCVDHIPIKSVHLTADIDTFIKHHINQRVTASTITNPIRETYGKNVSESDIYKYRNKLMYATLKESSDKPYGTPVERLISHFSSREDVSFIYVIHDMNYGFVNTEEMIPLLNRIKYRTIMMTVYMCTKMKWRHGERN